MYIIQYKDFANENDSDALTDSLCVVSYDS